MGGGGGGSAIRARRGGEPTSTSTSGGGGRRARHRTRTGGSLVEPSVGGGSAGNRRAPEGGSRARGPFACRRGALFFFFFSLSWFVGAPPSFVAGGEVVSRRAYRVQLVPGGDGEDITVGVEREARDRLAEVEAHEALRGLGAPQANLVVQRSAREHVRVRRVEPHDPRRASVPRERPQTRARAAVDELDRVVAVRGRDELPVGAERRRDRRPRRGSQLAVRRRAPRERVPLGPRAKRVSKRARRGGTARRTPGRRREPAARAEPTARSSSRAQRARTSRTRARGRPRRVAPPTDTQAPSRGTTCQVRGARASVFFRVRSSTLSGDPVKVSRRDVTAYVRK